MKVWIAIVLAFGLGVAQAKEPRDLFCHVVGVLDGDTFKCLEPATKTVEHVRFGAIDAPEKKMAYGQRSKQALSDLLFDRDVHVSVYKRDRHGRPVGTVWAPPTGCATCAPSVEVGLAMVRSGYAWWYRDFQRELTPAARLAYEAAEAEARSNRTGLWHDEIPVPPWIWRHSKGHNQKL